MNAAITIGPMLAEDTRVIAQLERALFVEDAWPTSVFRRDLRNLRRTYLVAKTDSAVIGYAALWRYPKSAHVANMAIAPDFQGQGIGKALLGSLLAMADGEGIDPVDLAVRVTNHRAIRLYEGFGFVATDILPGYYVDNAEDALIMVRRRP
ncbi:MAG: ribosomal protein S18-alanine N-acetyltransferase [bacterium]